ncbi:MAG: amidohydrolase, partial [Thermoanaerobaculia bacterium]
MAILAWLLLTTAPAVIVAQGTVGAEGADSWIASHDAELKALNQSIWSHPELGLQEHHAASELIRFLEQAGFEVERGVAGMPTAFVA